MSKMIRPSDALIQIYESGSGRRRFGGFRPLTEGKAEMLLRTLARAHRITDYDPSNGAYTTSPVVAATRLVDHAVRDILVRHARKDGASSVATRLAGLEPITSKESAVSASKVLGRLADSLDKNERVSASVKSGVASSREALGYLRNLLMKNPDASEASVRDVGTLESTLGSVTAIADNALSVVGAPKIKNSIYAALMGEEIPTDDEAAEEGNSWSHRATPENYTDDYSGDFEEVGTNEGRRFRGRRVAEATEDWWPLTALSAKKLRDAIMDELGILAQFSDWKQSALASMNRATGGLLATASIPVAVPSREYLLLAFSRFDIELSLYSFGAKDEGRYNVRAQLRWAHPTGGTNGATLGTFFIDQSGDRETVQFKAGY